jgi:hypothetical protein
MKFQSALALANATYALSGPVTGANSAAYAAAISDAHSVKSAAAAAVIAVIAKAKQILRR